MNVLCSLVYRSMAKHYTCKTFEMPWYWHWLFTAWTSIREHFKVNLARCLAVRVANSFAILVFSKLGDIVLSNRGIGLVWRIIKFLFFPWRGTPVCVIPDILKRNKIAHNMQHFEDKSRLRMTQGGRGGSWFWEILLIFSDHLEKFGGGFYLVELIILADGGAL